MFVRSRSSSKRALTLLKRNITSSRQSCKHHEPKSADAHKTGHGYVRHQSKPSPASQPANAAPGGAAAATATGGVAAAQAGGGSSKWELHPSFPADVRLLAAGIAGAGVLSYTLTSNSSGDAAGGKGAAMDGDPTQLPPQQGDTFQAEAGATPSELSEEPEFSDKHELPPLSSAAAVDADAEPQGAAEDRAGAGEEPAAGGGPPKEEEGPPLIVDSREVLGMIEDVFNKPAEQLVQEDYAAVAPQPPAGGPAAAAAAAEVAKERVDENLQAAQVAISTAIASDAAESVISDIAKAPKGVEAMTPSKRKAAAAGAGVTAVPEAPPPPPLVEMSEELAEAAARAAGVSPDVLRLLGITADVTAAGLLAYAAKRGRGPGDDWDEYASRHKQAESDAEALGALLTRAAQHVRQELSAAERVAAEGRAEADAARAAAVATAERLRSVVAKALQAAEQVHDRKMAEQAEALANAHAQFTVRERLERQAAIDDVRMKLGALVSALEKRADEARGGVAAHALAQGAFSLRSALDKGQKLDAAAEYLKKAAGGDALIGAAVGALPKGVAVPTREQLSKEFPSVERAARELAALPAGRGGMMAAAAAKLFAAMRVKEREPLASALPGGGIEAALAGVEVELVRGRLKEAAEKLEAAAEGTAAATAVKDWVAAARARAVAEMTASLVEAHAATATASLA